MRRQLLTVAFVFCMVGCSSNEKPADNEEPTPEVAAKGGDEAAKPPAIESEEGETAEAEVSTDASDTEEVEVKSRGVSSAAQEDAPKSRGGGGHAFWVRNNTRYPTSVAIAYHDGRKWHSEGWWTIQPFKKLELKSNYGRTHIYYRAKNSRGTCWKGSTWFRTINNVFHYVYAERGSVRGKKGYVEVNLGTGSVVYTVTLG
jgi:uncharacterized membrane protein